jgi:large subunit ribosomal protein L5
MESVKIKQKNSFKTLGEKFGYKNPLSAPSLVKVVLSVGTGKKVKADKKFNDHVLDRMGKIAGQKAVLRLSKKSIASFKLRQGEAIGVMVTLRGKKMFDFLDKLFNVAFPRTKDFRGVTATSVDHLGNMTLGIKEHTIFPEIQDEDIKDVFSFAVSIVTTAKSKDEAVAFLAMLGMPFTK